MLTSQQAIKLLRSDVVPAVGCTEPVCVALAAATAAAELGETVAAVDVAVSPGIYKNGMSAGIPACPEVGLDWAAALGALLANPERGLELFLDVTPQTIDAARSLVEAGSVRVDIEPGSTGVFARCELRGPRSNAACTIEGSHTNVTRVQKDGRPVELLANEGGREATGPNLVAKLREMTIAEIRDLVDGLGEDELVFMLDGVRMNLKLARHGMDEPAGVGLTAALRASEGGPVHSDGLLARMTIQAVAAAESRLDGCQMPAMSSSGAGTKGLVVIIPVYETARTLGSTQGQTVRALALAHLVNRYINAEIGKLSPMCTCVMAASTAASVGMAYLMGATNEQLGYAIRNMAGTVTGMICDGGKVGCALKVAAGTSAALMAAITAAASAPIRVSDGIAAESPEQCIQNMARVGREGMAAADQTILDIMQSAQRPAH